MAKKLEASELHELALELARNQHFVERTDDYEKQAIKNFIEADIWLYDQRVRIGLKNIQQDEIDKIRAYKRARAVLSMHELKRVFGDDLDAPDGPDEDKIDSNQVLGKLLALHAPNTKGEGGAIAWLTKIGYDEETANKRGRAVYNHFRSVKGYEDKFMVESTTHLEKMIQFIDVNPQFKTLRPTVNKYLKTATNKKKTKK